VLSFPEARRGRAQECPRCFNTVLVPVDDSGIGGKLPLPISTPRLGIRQLKTEDLPDYMEFITDEDSYRYLDYSSMEEGEAIKWFHHIRSVKLTEVSGYQALGIELRDEAKLIGYLELWLHDLRLSWQGAFHVMVNPKYRCRGYGTEAVRGAFGFAFEGLALHDIRVGIDARNAAARRMVEKAGMTLEGEFEEDCIVKGEWASTARYGILKKWYEERGRRSAGAA
jgi:[ribosomal protein S5]-alanine N-acetyltransferase